MNQYELTGGARIGMANATFPFAKLKVNQSKLELNATIIGNLVFSPKDIISIEPYQQGVLGGSGLKITHNVSEYEEKVIFLTFKNSEKVINEIRKTGFLDNTESENSQEYFQILRKQKQGGFPIKKPFAIGAVVIWNLLFALDFIKIFKNPSSDFIFGIGVKTAIGLLLTTAVFLLVSKSFRNLVLKEGRELDDIKTFLYFIILICCFFVLSFSMF